MTSHEAAPLYEWLADPLADDADLGITGGEVAYALLGEADVGAVVEVQDANLHAATLNLPVRWKVKRSRVRSCASVS